MSGRLLELCMDCFYEGFGFNFLILSENFGFIFIAECAKDAPSAQRFSKNL
jgi:hypothetical protein